jgi:glycosyltransferase involved in cell wall biosynthesis
MKILYDHQIFEAQTFGGISRYFFELMKCFNSDFKDVAFELPLSYSNNYYINNADFFNRKFNKINLHYDNFISKNYFKGKYKLFKLAQKTGLITDYSGINKKMSVASIKKQDFDVFHPTYYDGYFLEHIGKKPFVLTVYDMIHELFPAEFNHDDKFYELKKLLIEKASKVIAISGSTKRDIIKLYNKFEDKIEVVYLGNSLKPPAEKDFEVKTPENYLLFVGGRDKHKNFMFFIESIASLLKRDSGLSVLCAGGGAFSKKELAVFNKLGVGDKISQCSFNDDKLYFIYKRAMAFVFPSLYEGFGIPVLEAFASGCPLIVSNCSSLPEVAGGAAVYIDPLSGESIKSAVEKVIGDAGLRDELRLKGYEQLKKFSWLVTAQKTREIYEKLL